MNKLSLLLLSGSLLLASCESISQLTADYLLPADVSFPNQLRTVAIVNNMATAPQAENGEKSVLLDEKSQFLQVEQMQGDAKLAAEALAQAIASGNYFDEVLICDSALRTDTPAPISKDDVVRLTNDFNADFLLAVENVQLEAITQVAPDPYFGMLAGEVKVKVTPVVRAYIPGSTARMQVSKTDSIYWSSFGNSMREVRDEFVQHDDMFKQSSEHAGTFIARSILPHWTSATRFYFSSGSVDMRDAAVSVRERDWKQAVSLWSNAYNASKGRKKFHAAYNLALGYEMCDEIDEAVNWASQALQLANEFKKESDKNTYTSMASLYLDQLKDRQKGAAQVKLQMQRFDEEF